MGLCIAYTKPQGQQPDFKEPVVLSADRGCCTVEDFCNHIHRSLVKDGAQVHGTDLSIVASVICFRMKMWFRFQEKSSSVIGFQLYKNLGLMPSIRRQILRALYIQVLS
ncbi:uncharacterized protein [Nicotiana sylvestris]